MMLTIGCSQIGESKYYSQSKLQGLELLLKQGYLYDVELEKDQIADSIYKGYVGEIGNAATYYLDAEAFKQAKISNEGNYFGVGLRMIWENEGHSILVTDVIPNSSAEEANIKAGDHIIRIDDIEVIEANQEELLKKINASGQQAVSYTIKGSDNQERTVLLAAEEIELNDFSYELIEDILYIDVDNVKTGMSQSLQDVLNKYEKAKGIILDVRGIYTNNVEEISKLADLFLDEGTAFKVENKAKAMTDFLMKEGADRRPLVLLTDNETIGVTEALVNALSDRAVQVGSDTRGLAYVSEMIELEDGSGLCVATGILCDEFGVELPKKGLKPDIQVYMTTKEKLEYIREGKVSKKNDSVLVKALEQF